MAYSSLHNHSHFSLKGGLCTVKEWIKEAKKKNLSGISITDDANISCALELYELGKREKFPIVMGCDFYLSEDLSKKDPYDPYQKIVCLVKNEKGYQNLCNLSTLSSEQKSHFFLEPRISLNDLGAHREGLIVISGGHKGFVGKTILSNDEIDFITVSDLKAIFGSDFYLEVLPHDVSKVWDSQQNIFIDLRKDGSNPLEIVNKRIIELSNQLSIKVICSSNSYYLWEKQHIAQRVKHLNFIKSNSSLGKKIYSKNPLLSEEELWGKFQENHPYIDKAMFDKYCLNTLEILDKCKDLELNLSPSLPTVNLKEHPLYEEGMLPKKLMLEICKKSPRFRNTNKYVDRIKEEFQVIVNNGKTDLTNYFLLLEDLCRWCKRENVLVGIGRGSAGGSLLCYLMGITNINPLDWDLSFYRFINKSRILGNHLPDVDIDSSNPTMIKRYLINKYGGEFVASIGTTQNLKLKSSIKDIARVFYPEKNFSELNAITREIPTPPGSVDEKTWAIDYLKSPEAEKVRKFLFDNKRIADPLIDLIDNARQRGIHASAVCITGKPLKNFIPLARSNGVSYTQYTMEWCERAGAIKFDFLGLNTLKDIQGALQLIKDRTGKEIDPYNVDWEDPKVFEEFQKAKTDTVFQANTDLEKQLLTRIKTENLFELAAILSLGRPGITNLKMDVAYADRKSGRKSVDYFHNSLEPVLKDTYGVMLYQEQMMKALEVLADFNGEETDEARRAMGKKKPEMLKKYKEDFIIRTRKKHPDIDDKKANQLWNMIYAFTGYSFNLSHAAAYAMTSYLCQYLKVYYPLEWWCSVLSNSSSDDLKKYCPLAMPYLLEPTVNLIEENFVIRNDKIVTPLTVVNQVGPVALKEIKKIKDSRKKDFTSLTDFLTSGINLSIVDSDVMKNLIFAGLFKSLDLEDKATRDQYIEYLEYKIAKERKKAKVSSEIKSMNKLEMLQLRQKALPSFPMDFYQMFRDWFGDCDKYLAVRQNLKREYIIGGLLSEVKEIRTKKERKSMGFITIQNGSQKVRATLWPETYKIYEKELIKYKGLLKNNKAPLVKMTGYNNLWNNNLNFICNEIEWKD